jgi:diacylglycerol kinase (ATP)
MAGRKTGTFQRLGHCCHGAFGRSAHFVIVIYNPVAGQRRVHRLWQVLDILSGSGIGVTLLETAYAGHATELAAQAASSSATLVVAAGGDGTIAEVAAGLAGTTVKLGVIPLGTANVLAQELGLPFTPREIAACLAFGRTRHLWPGIVTSPGGTRLFVQMVGVGLDAQVVHRLPRGLKRHLGRNAYVAQTLREMLRYTYPPIRLCVDGEPLQAGSVVVTKGRFYAGHYKLAPGARPGEPGFSIALFGATGPASVLLYGAALVLNMLPRAPGMRLLRGRRIEIFGGGPAQADGDPAGAAPLMVRDASGPLAIVAPTAGSG